MKRRFWVFWRWFSVRIRRLVDGQLRRRIAVAEAGEGRDGVRKTAAVWRIPADDPGLRTTGNVGNNEISHMHAFVVLLTATIDPGQYKLDLMRYDPAQRLSDYEQSLLFWETVNDSRLEGIIFCENSGADLNPLVDMTRRFRTPVELISFNGNEKRGNMNYGYSELGIIDHAIRESTFLQKCSHFIKATGRLTFPKISRLLDSEKSNFDAIVDHRRKYHNEKGFPLRARTQLMLFSKSFYSNFLFDTRNQMVGGSGSIEEFIAQKLDKPPKEVNVIKRFNIECPPRGFSAYNNRNYDFIVDRYKNMARSLSRTLIPNLWI